MATRRATIATASAAPLWVFAHQAIWVRLLPMRETSSALALDLRSRSRPRPRAQHRTAYQCRERHAGGRRLGPSVGGLVRREADGRPRPGGA